MTRSAMILLGALLAPLAPLANTAVPSSLAAQHPPVSAFPREEAWLTMGDFRHVTAIAPGDADVYVGTSGGVTVLSGFGREWTGTVTAGDGLPASVVSALAFDAAGGRLWVGTSLGLAVYDPFRGQVIQDPLGLGAVPVREIRPGAGAPGGGSAALAESMFVLADGRWYAADAFTYRAEPAPERDVPPPPSSPDVGALPFLAGDAVRGERSGRPQSFPLTAAAELPGGRIVLGTWGGNAYVYDAGRLAAEPSPYGLAGPGGGAIGWDGARLWFTNAAEGTAALSRRSPARRVQDRDGVASASPALDGWRYAYPGLEAGLPSDRVRDVASGGGRTLFATDAGLAIFEEGAGWLRPPPGLTRGEDVLSVEAAADGLWLGTRRGLAAVRYGPQGPRDSAELPDASLDSARVAGRWLGDREVRALAADGRDLYAGTDLGLFRLTPGDEDPGRWTLSPVETSGSEVRDVVLLEGEVVVATERGVEILPRDAGGEPERYLVGESQLDERPLAVAADTRNVWIATAAGVSRWDRQRRLWTDYGLADGLPELPVLDVLVQDERHVWFSTPGGVTRFDLGEDGLGR